MGRIATRVREPTTTSPHRIHSAARKRHPDETSAEEERWPIQLTMEGNAMQKPLVLSALVFAGLTASPALVLAQNNPTATDQQDAVRATESQDRTAIADRARMADNDDGDNWGLLGLLGLAGLMGLSLLYARSGVRY
jgi:hypothetical protein